MEAHDVAHPKPEVRDSPTPLDRSSFVPLYYQLQEVLKQQIESGEWPAGTPLPGELALAERFGVSRVVVRQALGILADNRQIVRMRGVGTFVSQEKLESRVGGLIRLLSELGDGRMVIDVLTRRVEEIGESVQLRLGSEDRQALAVRFRVTVDGSVLAFGHSFFPNSEAERLLAGVDEGATLNTAFEQTDHLGRGEISIEASLCDPFEAQQLGARVGDPVFLAHCLEQIGTAGSLRPVELSRLVYRSDVVQFSFHREPAGENSHTLAPLWTLRRITESPRART